MHRIGLFLASEPFDGGAYQYSQAVLKALADQDKRAAEITVFYTNQCWEKEVNSYGFAHSEKIKPNVLNVVLMKLIKSGLLPLNIWHSYLCRFNALNRKVKYKNCAAWIFPSQDEWSYFFNVNAVVSIFDLMHRYESRFPEVSKGIKFYMREKHYQNICTRADVILVDSECGKTHVSESYEVDDEKIKVLPFTIPPYIHEKVIDKSFKMDLPKKYFFYPAQFWMHKNHISLLKSLANLVTEFPDLHVVFSGGKKNNYQNVLKFISEHNLNDHVTLLGYIDEVQMIELYSRARALIMPTYFGPTNIPPLEAMALGCPVAISGIYGMPEQIGEAGLLFDPGSIHSISGVMKQLWNDDKLCSELAAKGMEKSVTYRQDVFSRKLFKYISEGNKMNNCEYNI